MFNVIAFNVTAFNENEDKDIKRDTYAEKIKKIKTTYNESPFKSIIADIRNKLSKPGDKMIKKALYSVEEMKELTASQVNNIKEKLIKLKNI